MMPTMLHSTAFQLWGKFYLEDCAKWTYSFPLLLGAAHVNIKSVKALDVCTPFPQACSLLSTLVQDQLVRCQNYPTINNTLC